MNYIFQLDGISSRAKEHVTTLQLTTSSSLVLHLTVRNQITPIIIALAICIVNHIRLVGNQHKLALKFIAEI